MTLRVENGGLEHPATLVLLREHLAQMHQFSPPGTVHALDIAALKAPDISFYTAWLGDELAGCGALKALSNNAGEIKSMRTHAGHLRHGVGKTILMHIIKAAGKRGYDTLYLETGSGEVFEPALALYRKNGFVGCGAFGGYTATEFNQFLCLDL